MKMTPYILAAGIVTFACGAAHAGTVTAMLESVSPRQAVKIYFPGGNATVYAGKLNWERSQSNPGTHSMDVLNPEFSSYCIDVYQSVAVNQSYTFDVIDDELGFPMDLARAEKLAKLWGGYADEATTNDNAAAFQLAVWNIVYDNDASVSAGTFKTTTAGNFVATADSWLSALETYEGPIANLAALTSRTAQDQLVEMPLPPNVPVPLPAAGWAGLAMLAGLAGTRKLRRAVRGH